LTDRSLASLRFRPILSCARSPLKNLVRFAEAVQCTNTSTRSVCKTPVLDILKPPFVTVAFVTVALSVLILQRTLHGSRFSAVSVTRETMRVTRSHG
jgi:ABC-type uncharacterized transport system permease subunit